MHKGFRMLLEALGINIDPAEIEATFLKLKQDIPAIAQYLDTKFTSIDTKLDRIEGILQEQESKSSGKASEMQFVTGAELTLWESGEITYQEMRDTLMRRFNIAHRRKKGAVSNGSTDHLRITD
jgi:hypothetical protein